KAFSENVEEEALRVQVERLAAATAGWAEIARAYEQALGVLKGKKRLPLYETLARVYEKELGEPAKAIEMGQQILSIDPEHAHAMAALERLYPAAQRWGELLEIYEKKLALAGSAAEKKEIRYKIAHLYEEEAADRSKAITAYESILEEAGEELPALRALD